MSYYKTILCLANSHKPGGRCVAGKEIVDNSFGDWIRPVSDRPTEEVSGEERRYKDGSDPDLLDIIRVPMIRPKPTAFQSENHIIDPGYYWAKVDQANWSKILTAVDSISGPLWINVPGFPGSSYNGMHDRIPDATAATLKHSLLLIQPADLKISVEIEGAEFGNARRRVRVSFSFNQERYKLSVTDPVMRDHYLQGQDGVFHLKTALICVSLAGHNDGYAYKLAAAIITPERAK